MKIPKNQLCSSGCGEKAKYFSQSSGRFRCKKASAQCPVVRKLNSDGLKLSYSLGKRLGRGFSKEASNRGRLTYLKNMAAKPFHLIGKGLRKKIIAEEQGGKCIVCNLSTWLERPILLELDHIDGNRKNNLRSNQRLICPNCHSQTDTWKRGKSSKSHIERSVSDKEILKSFQKCGSISKVMENFNLVGGSWYWVSEVIKNSPLWRNWQTHNA